MQMFRLFFCVVFISGAFVGSTFGNPFRIQNISVEIRDDSLAQAKEKALRQARRKAFTTLIKKMVDPKQIDAFDNVEEVSISYLIDSMQVLKENVGSKAYKAVINFDFNKDRVETFLRKRAVEFVSPSSKTVMLLPVLSDGAKTYLFEQNNQWLRLWQESSLNQALCTLIIPNGDLKDIHSLDAEDAIIGASHSFTNIAARYGVDTIIVIHASIARHQASWTAGVDFQEYDNKGIKKHNIMKTHELSYPLDEKSKKEVLADLLKISMQQIRLGLRADFGSSSRSSKEFYLKFSSPTKEKYIKYVRLIEGSSLVSMVRPVQISRDYSFIRVQSSYKPQDLIRYLASHGYYFELSDTPISDEVQLQVQGNT